MELGENLIPDLNTLYNALTPLVQSAAQKQIYVDLQKNSAQAGESINIRSYGLVLTQSLKRGGK